MPAQVASSILSMPRNQALKAPTNPPDLYGRVTLAIARAQKKFPTVEALAEGVGVSRGAIYQWRDGSTENLKTAHFFKLCELADLSPTWVALGEGPQGPYHLGNDIWAIVSAYNEMPETAKRAVSSFVAFQASQPR